MTPATGAGPNVASRLYWLACSSLSGGTRFGIEASLAGVQNSEAHDARNWTVYIQVSGFAKPKREVEQQRQVEGGPEHVADDHVQPAVQPVRDRARQRAEQQRGQQGGQPDAADGRALRGDALPSQLRGQRR